MRAFLLFLTLLMRRATPGTDRINKAPHVSSRHDRAVQTGRSKQAKRDESFVRDPLRGKLSPSGVSIASTPVVTPKLPLKATQKHAGKTKGREHPLHKLRLRQRLLLCQGLIQFLHSVMGNRFGLYGQTFRSIPQTMALVNTC